jgi:hypothetical protein
MAATCRLVALAALGLAACEPPRPAVICHNGNCAAPTDPARDDTLGALRESLALTYQGRPLLDGVELDSLWRGADDVCLFAHDLETITEDVPATAPAEELATYFARPGPIGWRDDAPFEVLLELKSGTAIDPTVRHTPAQLAGHAACAWDIYEIVAAAAVANDRDVRVTMSAFAPELLAAVLAAAPTTLPVPLRYEALQGLPAPLDTETRPLADYHGLPIELVELHNQWITDAQADAVDALGADMSLFMFDATVETFAAIRQYRPVAVVTSEAELVRRWIER